MRLPLACLACVALVGCASAGKGNTIIGGIDDAGTQGAADAVTDGPGSITLTQTASATISPGNSFACGDGVHTAENTYYRVFTLADHGITTTLHVTQVEIGIQSATAGGGAGQQPATLRLGTYGTPPTTNELDLAQIRNLTSLDLRIPNGNGTRMTVPIAADVPATTSLVVELFVPDGTSAGNLFVIGSNADGERKPSYVRQPDCGFDVPTAMKVIARPGTEVDVVLSVTGTL
jgi:hypothetical protein